MGGRWGKRSKNCKWGKRDKRVKSNQESLCKGPKRRLQGIKFWYLLRGTKSSTLSRGKVEKSCNGRHGGKWGRKGPLSFATARF